MSIRINVEKAAIIDAVPFEVDKDRIWRRATDAEAEQMDALLRSQPVRIRRIYDGVSVIRSDGELYGVLRQGLIALFGEGRADELLASS